MCAKPASPLGEKHIFENQSVKDGKTLKGRHFWLFGVYCFAAGLLAMYSA